MLPNCYECKRELHEHESAWAYDWKVIETSGQTATVRNETRYTCDSCADGGAS